MDPITLGILGVIAIGGAVINAVGAVVNAVGQKDEAYKAAERAKEQARINEEIRKSNYNAFLASAQDQLNSDKEQAFQRATDIETETKLGFTGAMTSTYLGQIQAEMGYTDMLQQNAEATGGLATQNAISGTKQNTRAGNIIGQQLAARQDAARTQIDRSRDAAITQAVGQKDIAMGQAGRLRSMFNEGSTYMTAYNNRLTAAANQSGLQATAYQADNTYLNSVMYDNSAANPWNWAEIGLVALGGAFDVAGSFMNLGGGQAGKGGGGVTMKGIT